MFENLNEFPYTFPLSKFSLLSIFADNALSSDDRKMRLMKKAIVRGEWLFLIGASLSSFARLVSSLKVGKAHGGRERGPVCEDKLIGVRSPEPRVAPAIPLL